MRQPWTKTNVDGAKFRQADGELDRVYNEMPRLPEPPAQAIGEEPEAPASPPKSQPRSIAPPVETEEEPARCTNPACKRAFEEASESGSALVQGSGSGCTDERKADEPAKVPNPDRRKA